MEAILKVGAVKTEEGVEARLDSVCQTNPIFSFYPIVFVILWSCSIFQLPFSCFLQAGGRQRELPKPTGCCGAEKES